MGQVMVEDKSSPNADGDPYRSFFQEAPAALLVISEDREIVAANSSAAAFLGATPESLIGRPATALVATGYIETLVSVLRTVAKGRIESTRLRMRRIDGTEVHAAVQCHPVASGFKTHVIASLTDATESTELTKQLHHAQRLEALGQLVGGLAHDFNNLLSVMLGHAEFLSDDLTDPSHIDDLTQIVSAAHRAKDVVSRLLAFGRKQTLRTEVLEVREFLTIQIRMLERVLREAVVLQLDVPEGVPPILADRGQLEQIVMNLAINAQQAMSEGGSLFISARPAHLDTPRGELTPGDYTVIELRDTGHGMNEATRARVFEPFFTTKPRGQGTGLGLAMVYGSMRQHGGHVEVASEVGRGSTFSLYLPQATEIPVVEQLPPPQAEQRGRGERVLLVEDSDVVRDITRRFLARLGYVVTAVPSCEEARAALESSGREGAIDLMLTDVLLTDGTGRDLYAVAKTLSPPLAVLFMSGYPENVLTRDGTLEPGLNLLAKPFSREALARAVREALVSSQLD